MLSERGTVFVGVRVGFFAAIDFPASPTVVSRKAHTRRRHEPPKLFQYPRRGAQRLFVVKAAHLHLLNLTEHNRTRLAACSHQLWNLNIPQVLNMVHGALCPTHGCSLKSFFRICQVPSATCHLCLRIGVHAPVFLGPLSIASCANLGGVKTSQRSKVLARPLCVHSSIDQAVGSTRSAGSDEGQPSKTSAGFSVLNHFFRGAASFRPLSIFHAHHLIFRECSLSFSDSSQQLTDLRVPMLKSTTSIPPFKISLDLSFTTGACQSLFPSGQGRRKNGDTASHLQIRKTVTIG